MQTGSENPAIAQERLFDFATMAASDRAKLLLATVIPRPIAWIVSMNLNGQLNAAPFSFFNAFAVDPPIVGIGIGSHEPGLPHAPKRPKDTRRNIRDTGQFVINLVSEEMARAMSITAIEFGPQVSELSEAGVETVPSVYVSPPRIAGCPVAMECELMQIVNLGTDTGLVLGRVLAMHIREDAILDPGRHYIDAAKMKLIGRMHGSWYTRTADTFQMSRIAREDWKAYLSG